TGQFLPQTAGSSVASSSSTTRKKGFFASCLRSMMFTRSAVTAAAANAAVAAMATRTRRLTRRAPSPDPASVMTVLPGDVGGGELEVADRAMAPHAREVARPRVGGGAHGRDHRLVTPTAVRLRDLAAPRGGPDRLHEGARREVVRVPEAVVRLGVVLAHEVV